MYFAYLASRSKRKSTIILYSIISIMIPVFLGGLRAKSVGTDTGGYGYRDALDAIYSISFYDFMTHDATIREPLYKIVCYTFANLFQHPNGALFAYQLITVACVYVGCWRFRKVAPPPWHS